MTDQGLIRLNEMCLMSQTVGDVRIKSSIKSIGLKETESSVEIETRSSLPDRSEEPTTTQGSIPPLKSSLSKKDSKAKRDLKVKKVGITWCLTDRVKTIPGREITHVNPNREAMLLRLGTLFMKDLKVRRETSALSRGNLYNLSGNQKKTRFSCFSEYEAF